MAHVAFAARPPRATPLAVRPRDRLLNMVAGVCVVSGTALFFLARRTLGAIASGTFSIPVGSGMTHVAFTDSVVMRSRVGIWLVVVGAILAVAAAISHRFARHA